MPDSPSRDAPATGWCLLAFVGLVLTFSVAGFWVLPVSLEADALVGPSAILLGASVAAGALLLGVFHGRRPGALGFYLRPAAVPESALGLGLGIAVAGVAVLFLAATGAVGWVEDGGGPGELALEGLAALALLALPAAAEEALFRGYPLQVLAHAWGPLPALGFTALAFGLLHGANPEMTMLALGNLVGAGLFLGAVYLRTGSLWWATGAHLGWNWALGYGADLPVSGLELIDTPLWTGVTRGPEWWSGGAFGPEGSLASTAVFFGAAAALWWSGWPRPGRAAVESDPLTPLPAGGDGELRFDSDAQAVHPGARVVRQTSRTRRSTGDT